LQYLGFCAILTGIEIRETAMLDAVQMTLSSIRTVDDMVAVFADEERCRRLLEAMIWSDGRACPACGSRRSIALAGRDTGRHRARPGLYQCSDGNCRFQFTVTTRTPLHSTKLPLGIWLKAMWLILQSDKGLSSVRLAEALGVSQPTAWRLGHALRLMMTPTDRLGGTVEIDGFYIGGDPKKGADGPAPGRGRKGLRKTLKTPVLAVVQRPTDDNPGAPAGAARASVVNNLSANEAGRVLEKGVQRTAHLISDEWKAFVALGHNFVTHDTVRHSKQEYVRGDVHANSVEGFNSRVQRTVAGVFHHISPEHADLYFHEIGFRWSQRIAGNRVDRKTRNGRVKSRRLWSRIAPALQIQQLLRGAAGQQIRRSSIGGIVINP
jgi:transposase-like protein